MKKKSKLPIAYLTSESDHFNRYESIAVILVHDMPVQGLLCVRDEQKWKDMNRHDLTFWGCHAKVFSALTTHDILFSATKEFGR
jgi:hypothetical protein